MANGAGSAASTGGKPSWLPASRAHASSAAYRGEAVAVGMGAFIAHENAMARLSLQFRTFFRLSSLRAIEDSQPSATFNNERSCHENENCLPGRLAGVACAVRRYPTGPC